jgi:hypothetical protein
MFNLLFIFRQSGSISILFPFLKKLKNKKLLIRVICFKHAYIMIKEMNLIQSGMFFFPVKNETEAQIYFNKFILESSIVITGTSEKAKQDAWFWHNSNKREIMTIAFIDRNINLLDRFRNLKKCEFPRQIITTDANHIEFLMKHLSTEIKYKVLKNPSFLFLRNQIHNQNIKSHEKSIVFLTEPQINENDFFINYGFSQFDSFDLFQEIAEKYFKYNVKYIRVHFRDDKKKWEDKIYGLENYKIDNNGKLTRLLISSHFFGITTVFLDEACALSKKAYSLQPNTKKTISLAEDISIISNINDFKFNV